MKKTIFTTGLLIVIPFISIHGQEKNSLLIEKLANIGFENIRINQDNKQLSLSIEDNLYRWHIDGIKVALDTITYYAGKNTKLHLFILKNNIPQIVLEVPIETWQDHHKNLKPVEDANSTLKVLNVEENEWKKFRQFPGYNLSAKKVDITIYPQLFMHNTLLTQIYEVQLNIAPAIELSLWKGMFFRGQIIFPLINDLGEEGDCIRPGYFTLAQDFRLPHSWFGKISIGNFSASRYGADILINHPFRNKHWTLGCNVGLTGSSHFYDGVWVSEKPNALTWFITSSYYHPKFNLRFDMNFGCYLNNDHGVRFDIMRQFGPTSVGFFAMYTADNLNGGFRFSAPIPPFKRNRKRSIRIIPTNYFNWEYNAGTEFYYGRIYRTSPNNPNSKIFSPLYYEHNLKLTL